MKVKILATIFIGTVLFLLLLIFSFLKGNFANSIIVNGTAEIGKELTIVISEDTAIDGEYIKKVCNKEVFYDKPFFDMLDDKECRKLIDYLSENDFVIVPGKYIINQVSSFEDIIDILVFTKK